MEKEKFKNLTKDLLKYSPRLDRDVLIKRTRSCEYCTATVSNQHVVCEGYRLGTQHQYFKHTCKSCKFVLYDGSYAIEANRHRRPDAAPRPPSPSKGRPRGTSRSLQTPMGLFPSLKDASEHYGRSPSTVIYWIRQQPTEFYYVK